MPNVKIKSLIRLTIIAFNDDLLACILVNQKLISKKEQSPTPSQPRNSIIKLSPVTKIFIKNVNNEIYDIKRIKCGSCAI
jgi:hypothetical protein